MRSSFLKVPGQLKGTNSEEPFLVLELGHEGTDWATRRPRIHVELCDFRPEPRQWEERRKGVWVESHATYDYMDPNSAEKGT
jgi:hypothetical protein